MLASHALARRQAADGAVPASSLLGPAAPQIWAAFEELCEALLRPGPGDATHDVPPTPDELATAAEALTRRVDEVLPIVSHVTGGLGLALGGVLRDAERTSAAFVPPTREERSTWAAAFLARLQRPD